MTVPVSLTAPQFRADPDALLAAAHRVDDLGLAGLFFLDHLVPLSSPAGPVHELAASLGAVAGLGLPIRLGTLVARAPLRGPEVTAALGVTAGRLGAGGFVLGLGAGDRLSYDEIDRYGLARLPLAERIESVAATIRLLRTMSPGMEAWVGGRHEGLLEVAAELADGWNGWMLTPAQLASTAARLTASRPGFTVTWGGGIALAPRSADPVGSGSMADGVLAGTPRRVASALRDLLSAGADELVVTLRPNVPEQWELFAAEVVTRL